MTWHWIASLAAALSGWKYAEPWSPSITVIVPPGLSIAFSRASASTGSREVLEHEAHEDVVEGARREGSAKMSACAELDVGQPAAARRATSATDSAETSIDVKCAFGLRADSVTVCAPTPQPASSTRAPAG